VPATFHNPIFQGTSTMPLTQQQQTDLQLAINRAETSRLWQLERLNEIVGVLKTVTLKDNFLVASVDKLHERKRGEINSAAVADVEAAVAQLLK
jgi:hypothetical protein